MFIEVFIKREYNFVARIKVVKTSSKMISNCVVSNGSTYVSEISLVHFNTEIYGRGRVGMVEQSKLFGKIPSNLRENNIR